jgi:CelD/BcsL family acetyltransferase involved in cellulose biosynthesis
VAKEFVAAAEEIQSPVDERRPIVSKAEPVHPGSDSYMLSSDVLGGSGESLTQLWQRFQETHSPDDPLQDPDWLKGFFEGQADNLRFYSLHRGGDLCGLVPFLRRDWPMALHLGPWRLAELPLRRLRLLGSTVNLPDEDAAYDLVFRELAKPGSGYDTVFLEDVPIDSYLWGYLHRSPLIRSSFLTYEPDRPSPRLLIRVEGTFDEYMGKFSGKHRKNLLREVKKLREGALGEMRLVRFESPGDAGVFLERAFELSRKTYQWSQYQRGLSATDLIAARVKFAASRGWLRSYLLQCGGRTCAFVLGFQHRGRFLLHEIGFDPELAKFSVGTVSLLLTLEDLFNDRSPSVVDFESYGKYKEALSTESYLQCKVYLFRPGVYARLLRSGHRGCAKANAFLSSLSERVNLKRRLRSRLRGWNSGPKPKDA